MTVTVRIITTCLVVTLGSVALAERQDPTSLMVLPESALLSEVEIQWQSGGGDGCAGDCTNYRITVRGDGLVTLEDLGWGSKAPKAAPRQRSIPVDNAVALIDELLKARFLEAPSSFAGARVARRKGDLVFFSWSVQAGAPWVDLTLRAGPKAKTVRMVNELTPQELRNVERRLWEIGGPKAWPAR